MNKNKILTAFFVGTFVLVSSSVLIKSYQSQQKAQERQQVAGAFSAIDFSLSKSSSSRPKLQARNLKLADQGEEDLLKKTANGVNLKPVSSKSSSSQRSQQKIPQSKEATEIFVDNSLEKVEFEDEVVQIVLKEVVENASETIQGENSGLNSASPSSSQANSENQSFASNSQASLASQTSQIVESSSSSKAGEESFYSTYTSTQTSQIITTTFDSNLENADLDSIYSVYYQTCSAAKVAGMAPIYFGEAGYEMVLDRDNNGIIC